MMMRQSAVLILVFLFAPLKIFSQEKLTYNNGREEEGKIISLDSSYIVMDVKRGKKTRRESIELYRVFSTTDQSGKETIHYMQDSLIGNLYDVKDMTFFVTGEKDAYRHFNPVATKIVGFCLGLGVSLLDTYDYHDGMFRSEPGLVHVATPFLFPIVAGLPRVTYHVSKISDRSLLAEPAYRDGFERVVKIKRTFGALKFSLAGSLLGLGAYYLYNAVK